VATKTHLACEQDQKVLSLIVTAGHRGDSPQFIPILRRIRVTRLGVGRPRTCPDLVLADKAYTGRANRGYLRSRGIKACIPSKKDQDAHRKAKGSKAAARPRSTGTSTGCAAPWRTASTASNAIAASRLATTNSPSASKPS
jgi:transposase